MRNGYATMWVLIQILPGVLIMGDIAAAMASHLRLVAGSWP